VLLQQALPWVGRHSRARVRQVSTLQQQQQQQQQQQ
jgi:hypothetical protein